ncbi:hypothetical protein CYMTET_45844 [Cymbomonas tetramitiformis]|uniref:DOMON domain-containing protein n=1 Tax=Cymbomonas tetramitiformis TaxID=36881 RepID=A0AAE0BYN9_9CHLO|nr:hypothetical protein CYMTET_45844 [Cymbomonas tetramitiformis]
MGLCVLSPRSYGGYAAGFALLMRLVSAVAEEVGSSYENHAENVLPGYNLHWSVVKAAEDADAYFELCIEAATTGWVAFGVAEPFSGSMDGSDLVVANVQDGTVEVSDRYATAKMTPIEDCSQDWQVVNGWEIDGRTVVQLRRKLDTNDGQDRPLKDTGRLTRVIVATGTADSFTYHGSSRRGLQLPIFPSTTPSISALQDEADIVQVELRPSSSLSGVCTEGCQGYRNWNKEGDWTPALWERLVGASSDNHNLSLAAYGDASGAEDVILALHGFPDGGALYFTELCEYLVDKLGSSWACLALEQRGCNQSDIPQETTAYNIALLSADVISIAEQFVPHATGRRVHLLAHDWGGPVAFAAGLERNDGRFASIIALNAPDGRVWAEAIHTDDRQQEAANYIHPFLNSSYSMTAAYASSWFKDANWFSNYQTAYERAWEEGCHNGLCSIDAGLLWYRANIHTPTAYSWEGVTTEFDDFAKDPIEAPVLAVWGMADDAFNIQRMIDGGRNHSANFTLFQVEGLGHFDVAHDYSVAEAVGAFLSGGQGIELPPQQVTTYVDLCYNLTQMIGEAADASDGDDFWHIVGFEHLVESATEKYLHHFTVHGSTDSEDCADSNAMIWGWAPGGAPLALPETAGVPVAHGGTPRSDATRKYRSIRVNTHYDNPDMDADVKDNSGVKLYISKKRREHDAGLLELGDPSVGLFGVTVPSGFSKVEFTCPSECTQGLENPVTVYASSLHMHQSGIAMHTKQYRAAAELELSDQGREIEYYAFDYQDTNAASFQLQPGDEFHSTCYYQTAASSNVKFGLASNEEMCIDFLYYYPLSSHFEAMGGACGLGSCGRISQAVTSLSSTQFNDVKQWPSNSSCTSTLDSTPPSSDIPPPSSDAETSESNDSSGHSPKVSSQSPGAYAAFMLVAYCVFALQQG